jgi:hypothetical protein
VEDRDARRVAAYLYQGDAQLFFVVGQHRVRGRQRLEHQVGHAVPGALHALAQVLRSRGLHRHQVHLDLEARARHPDGIRDAALLVHDVLLRDVVQELVIPAERHRPRHLVHAGHVLRADFFAAHGDHARGAARRDMFAGDAARHVRHFHAGHALSVFERGGHGAGGLVDVPHHTAPHAAVLGQAHPKHFGERRARQIAHHLRDHRARLRAAEIEPGHEAALRHQALAFRRTTTCPA